MSFAPYQNDQQRFYFLRSNKTNFTNHNEISVHILLAASNLLDINRELRISRLELIEYQTIRQKVFSPVSR